MHLATPHFSTSNILYLNFTAKHTYQFTDKLTIQETMYTQVTP